jgi:hypothetical protein
MQLGTDTTQDGGMRLTVTYGPTLLSVIFDVDDEDAVMKVLQTGFEEARRLRENGHVHSG